LLAVIGIVYGAIVAAGQSDLKRFVTFTSIAHFGFIALGFSPSPPVDRRGRAVHGQPRHRDRAAVHRGRHARRRGGSKLIGDYGGVWKVAPLLGGMFLVASLATVALPARTRSSPIPVLIGTFTRYRAGR